MNGLDVKYVMTGLLLAAVLAGCSGPLALTEPAVAAGPGASATTAATAPTSPIAPRSRNAAGIPVPPHLDKTHPISDKRSVYFDLADHTLPPEAVALLQLHGMYLLAHPDIHIRIEGNTDELGGTEYNLALGQRRADSVANTLKVMGVQDAQLETVSFGKERPRALGHDEDAWAENRRADLIYPSE